MSYTHTHARTNQRNPIKLFLLCTDSVVAFYFITVPFLSFTYKIILFHHAGPEISQGESFKMRNIK
jgi:hypothetical protein